MMGDWNVVVEAGCHLSGRNERVCMMRCGLIVAEREDETEEQCEKVAQCDAPERFPFRDSIGAFCLERYPSLGAKDSE
jgi:hypothetical protein